MDLRYVKKLVELLDQSTVDSIEISSDKGMKIRLSKTPQQRGAVQMAPSMVLPAAAAIAAIPASRGTPADGVPFVAADDGAVAVVVPKAKPLLEVKSPMVGTFYVSPEPGTPAYVNEGQRIEKGQTLCIIEAMKIMNEIESEFAGVVKEISAADAHPVEYGQVLFRIDPNG
ncbi:MAG: acetyl-CoA carboxylase biotin carboxyl carrier protein [Gemmatimonadota bacterium]|nr:acetyl-CoA carboxylase biotin carboxyl carrier protein [Gemmatimonadota bacterium]